MHLFGILLSLVWVTLKLFPACKKRLFVLHLSCDNLFPSQFHVALFTFVSINPDDYSWKTHVTLQSLLIEGDYFMDADILGFQMNHPGHCWIQPSEYIFKIDDSSRFKLSFSFLENMDVYIITKTELITKDDHVFFKVIDTDVDLTIGELKVRLNDWEQAGQFIGT